jgi:predicted esterase YcpF (UPF0227 family)
MKSTIVYLHGVGSSPDSDTGKQIRSAFPHEQHIAPSIDHMQHPAKIRKQMDDLADHLKTHHDPIIVGSSAGGFWGDYMAAKHGIKSVLVNPSLKPSENFKKYNLPAEHYEEYKKLEKETENHPRHHAVAFHGTKDDVVPLKHITARYKKPIHLEGEGHRLKDMTPVLNMMKSMVGNFPEHH